MSKSVYENINEIAVHNDFEIKGFFKEYRFLSNFYKASFIDRDGIIWDTSEHFYQAMKSESITEQETVRLASLNKVKRLGRKVVLREGWDEGLKDKIMFEALVYKFTQNVDLRLQLLETDDKFLEETNYWKDTYWGVFEGKGQNNLGKQLMRLREILKWEDLNGQRSNNTKGDGV